MVVRGSWSAGGVVVETLGCYVVGDGCNRSGDVAVVVVKGGGGGEGRENNRLILSLQIGKLFLVWCRSQEV